MPSSESQKRQDTFFVTQFRIFFRSREQIRSFFSAAVVVSRSELMEHFVETIFWALTFQPLHRIQMHSTNDERNQ